MILAAPLLTLFSLIAEIMILLFSICFSKFHQVDHRSETYSYNQDHVLNKEEVEKGNLKDQITVAHMIS